jgi:hypothetical protein
MAIFLHDTDLYNCDDTVLLFDLVKKNFFNLVLATKLLLLLQLSLFNSKDDADNETFKLDFSLIDDFLVFLENNDIIKNLNFY